MGDWPRQYQQKRKESPGALREWLKYQGYAHGVVQPGRMMIGMLKLNGK
jgi:hypothetical protein